MNAFKLDDKTMADNLRIAPAGAKAVEGRDAWRFQFGDKVRRIGHRDVFVVLGWDAPHRCYQIAALNHKTSAKSHELERA